MVPSFVPLGALIKVAPVVAVPKAKVAASYIVSDTTPAADSYVVEAVVEEPDPRDEEPVRARDSVTYDRYDFVSDMKSLEIEILMLESEMHHMKGWDDQGVMMDTHR
jgi:hypothetical protein